MTKNKKSRAGRARGTCETKTRRGQANAVFTRHYNATRQELQSLAVCAAQNARRCERRETKRKFERIARYLARRARGEQTR